MPCRTVVRRPADRSVSRFRRRLIDLSGDTGRGSLR